MIKNYLKIAWRNLQKNKATSLINVLGLSIGIGASLIIFMIVRYDSSFDKWEPNNKDVYRVYTYSGEDDINSGVTTALPQAIKEQLTGVDEVSHFLYLNTASNAVLQNEDGTTKSFPKNEGVVYADASFFSIFPHQWLFGNSASALGDPNAVVLTRSVAEKFFPNQPLSGVIGRRIRFGDSINVMVSGIVDDLKARSDFNYQIFISLPTLTSNAGLKKSYRWGSWGNINYASLCVVRLKEGTSPSSVEKAMKDMDDRNNKPEAGMHGDEPKLLSISENHFAMDIDGTIAKSTLLSLSLIALFILSLAVINYVNLATAQSSLRAKEMGVRKVLGGNPRQIRLQFLIETFLVSLVSALLSIAMIPLLMKGFSNYLPKEFTASDVLNYSGIICLVFLIVVLTFAAGIYPAFVLAKFEPARVLKSNPSAKGVKNTLVRKILIVGQFATAQVLLILVMIVSRQVHFSLNKNLGYKNVKGIISFFVPDGQKSDQSHKYLLADQIKQLPGITEVSLNKAPPTSNMQSISVASAIVKGQKLSFSIWQLSGDVNYTNLFGIPVVAGTNITADTASNPLPVLVNETFARQIGETDPQNMINKIFDYDGNRAIVKGVLHDFNSGSLKSSITPVVYYYDKDHASMISVLLGGEPMNWQSDIEKIQSVYKKIYPDNLFDYSFLDQSIAKLYKQDIAISKTLSWATGLAILISCLGLFGLVTFMANQRRKEVGIRKVLGASVYQIVSMLTKSMVKLVMLASAIAFPIAWFVSNKWLQNYAYKIDIGWTVFVIAGLAAISIALLTVSFQAVKAAVVNPVKSLRSE